jgi:hypothetical protein
MHSNKEDGVFIKSNFMYPFFQRFRLFWHSFC